MSLAKQTREYCENQGYAAYRTNQIATIFGKDRKDNMASSDVFRKTVTPNALLFKRLYEYSTSDDLRIYKGHKDGLDLLIIDEASRFLEEIYNKDRKFRDIKDTANKRYRQGITKVDLQANLQSRISTYVAYISSRVYKQFDAFYNLNFIDDVKEKTGDFIDPYSFMPSSSDILAAHFYEARFMHAEQRLSTIDSIDDLKLLDFGMMIAGTIKNPKIKKDAIEVMNNPKIFLSDAILDASRSTVVDEFHGDEI